MPRYAYNAKDVSGAVVSGYRQGDSAGKVAQELAATGMVPLQISEFARPEVRLKNKIQLELSWFYA